MKKRKNKGYRTLIKLMVCAIHIIVIMILALCSFKVYKNGDRPINLSNAKNTKQYVYLDISEMSPKITDLGKNKQVHYVIEKTDNDKWYTYLIAINKSDEKKFKSMIEYTEQTSDEVPDKIRVYGYPVEITSSIKKAAIKNSDTLFGETDEKNTLTNKNFEKYLTNHYLDTTIEQHHEFNYVMLILLLMIVVLIITLILVIFDKDKFVDEVDRITEESIKKHKKQEAKENQKRVKEVKKALKAEQKK